MRLADLFGNAGNAQLAPLQAMAESTARVVAIALRHELGDFDTERQGWTVAHCNRCRRRVGIAVRLDEPTNGAVYSAKAAIHFDLSELDRFCEGELR